MFHQLLFTNYYF